jgi:predicted membrane-bound mannosyltransferase
MLTVFGACAVTFMMLMYALERRDRRFILAFAFGCGLSSVYGFLAGTWPFGVVEAIWAAIAVQRYVQTGHDARPRSVDARAEPVASTEHDRERAVHR